MVAETLPEDGTVGMTVLKWIYFVVVFFLSLLLVLLLLPISLLVRIYRTVLVNRVKEELGDSVMMATGTDAVWLQDTPNNRAIISALLYVKGKTKLETCRQLVMERMIERKHHDDPGKPLFPKLTMYASKSHRRYVWLKDNDFNIDEHIRMFDKQLKSNQELQEEVGRICSRGLPEKKSPWEAILIPPFEGSDECVIVFRVHHSIGDGISLVRSFVHCLADKPPEEVKSHRFGAQGNKFFKILKSAIEAPGTVLLRVIKPMDVNVLHGPVPTGTKIVAWSKQLDLELVKTIKNATGTTVNDVLFSCLAGALGDYMRQSSSKLPTDICASVPVDIRTTKKLEMDNQFAVVFVDLPLDEEDPVMLLKRMKKRMDIVKGSPEPVVNSLIIALCMARMPNWLSKFMLDWLTNKCSMVVSNVPGPSVPMQVSGQLVDDLVFWPPQRKDVAVGISILSYNNHLRIGVMTDQAVMTNPSILTDLFVERLQKLASALKIE